MKELPVLLIDNKNSFCSKTMRIIYRYGGYDKFIFLSIYSNESKNLLSEYGLSPNAENLTVLLEKGKVFIKSGAILQAARKLNGGIQLFYGLNLIPASVRDFFYDKISGYTST